MTGRPVVLVIDDSAEVRSVIGAVLQRKGFDIVEAHDPPSAIEALKSGTFATIFLDLKMPHDGVAMLDYIGESLPELLPKVIVLLPPVGHDVRAVLSKPLDLAELARVVTSREKSYV